MKQVILLGILLGCLFNAGCQGPRPAAPDLARPTLSVSPPSATVTVNRTLTFSGLVTGGEDETLVWSVLEPTGGRVDASGLYQAPALPGAYTLQLGLRSGPPTVRARITVVPRPDGHIAAPARVTQGATGLKASVPAVPGSRYVWSVQGGKILDGAASDTVTFEAGTGLRVVLLCKVTNGAGDILNSSLEIPMAAPVFLAITPRSVILTAGRTMKFGFDLRGGTSSEVLWRVKEPGCGMVDGTGNYTAPASPGLCDVVATAKDDPSKTAVASVKVVAEPAGVIQVPSRILADEPGLTATVTPQEGMTYLWDITGGTLLAGAQGPVLTFKSGAGPLLILHCRIQNEAGDSLLVARELPIVKQAP